MFSIILAKVNNYREIIFLLLKTYWIARYSIKKAYICDDAVDGFVETDISFVYQSMALERRKNT